MASLEIRQAQTQGYQTSEMPWKFVPVPLWRQGVPMYSSGCPGLQGAGIIGVCHQSQLCFPCLWDCVGPDLLCGSSLSCSALLTWECVFMLDLSFPICNTKGATKSDASESICVDAG